MKQVSNFALRDLWHGDGDSHGYAHEHITHELAKRLKPKNPRELLDFLYPNTETEDIPKECLQLIDRGYFKWKDPEAYLRKYWMKKEAA